MGSTTRSAVLSLYRRILRTGKTWTALKPEDTQKEKSYIVREAKTMFRENKGLTDAAQIQSKIREGQARLDIAVHYKIPYPRPIYLPPLARTKRPKTSRKS